jgi:multisubunit Na+/H+ antiporter MnhB subunit
VSTAVETRKPRRRGSALVEYLPFVVVLALVGFGLLRIAMYHWREGAVLIGGALLVAAVLRAALAHRNLALLAIRTRTVDVLSYAGLGLLILFVALTITGGPLR